MKDILGREIKKGDLIVAKGTGRYNAGLRIGVMRDNSVRFQNGNCSAYGEMYIIENPTEKESAIREEILNLERRMEESRIQELEKRKSFKAIPKKDLEIGRLYEDDKGKQYIYLGNCRTEFLEDSWNENWQQTWRKPPLVGLTFISIDRWCFNREDNTFLFNYQTLLNTFTRKTMPRFVKALDVKIEFVNGKIEKIQEREKPERMYSVWGRETRKKVTIIQKEK